MKIYNGLCLKKSAILFLIQIILVVSIFPFSQSVFGESAEAGGFSSIVTSNNPDFRSEITANGDIISVKGVHKSDFPVSVGLSSLSQTDGIRFKSEGGGAYVAEIRQKPIQNGYYNFYIQLKSGAIIAYLMRYENGWSFPDNGLAALNEEKLKNIYDADPKAAAYYISVKADKSEIENTLSEIRKIAAEVCKDETDDYKKAYLLNRWMADNIYYDHVAAETEVTLDTVAISSVLKRRRTTCAGFANTYSALLEAVGIKSVNLKGAAASGDVTYKTLTTAGENHEFVAFWYEKENRWAYADPCWSGAGDYFSDLNITQRITHDKYFDISGEAFSFDHRVDKAERRLYFKASEALDPSGDDTQKTKDASETLEATPEASKSPSISSDKDSNPPASLSSRPKPSENAKDPERQNIVPFVIIGLMGVMVILAGVILAAHKKK